MAYIIGNYILYSGMYTHLAVGRSLEISANFISNSTSQRLPVTPIHYLRQLSVQRPTVAEIDAAVGVCVKEFVGSKSQLLLQLFAMQIAIITVEVFVNVICCIVHDARGSWG